MEIGIFFNSLTDSIIFLILHDLKFDYLYFLYTRRMENQDWTIVTFRRTHKKNIYSPRNEKTRMTKLTDSNPKSCINPTSLQVLIRTRIEMKLSQSMADTICDFPDNTFKNIESKLILPSDEQKCRIQQQFDIYLKTDTI